MSEIENNIKEIQRILRELKRTDETHGCYNPYNLGYPYIDQIVRETLEDLRIRVKVCLPQKVVEAATK